LFKLAICFGTGSKILMIVIVVIKLSVVVPCSVIIHKITSGDIIVDVLRWETKKIIAIVS